MKKRALIFALTAAAAAVPLLTACGGKTSDSPSSASGDASSESSDELYVYNWGEYIDEDVITQFEDETGIRVVYDLFETNEEMYPIIEAGAVTYDVVCPSDYMIQKMVENDLLAEINFDNVPNVDQIDPGLHGDVQGLRPGE